MRRENRPDGIVSGAGGATFALVAGIEDAGLVVGRRCRHHFQTVGEAAAPVPAGLLVVDEDFRLAGRELARAVVAAIDGQPARALQSLSHPGPVLARGE